MQYPSPAIGEVDPAGDSWAGSPGESCDVGHALCAVSNRSIIESTAADTSVSTFSLYAFGRLAGLRVSWLGLAGLLLAAGAVGRRAAGVRAFADLPDFADLTAAGCICATAAAATTAPDLLGTFHWGRDDSLPGS